MKLGLYTRIYRQIYYNIKNYWTVLNKKPAFMDYQIDNNFTHNLFNWEILCCKESSLKSIKLATTNSYYSIKKRKNIRNKLNVLKILNIYNQ